MKTQTTCKLLEQYLSYLSVVKERSQCTINMYRTDISLFLHWLAKHRTNSCSGDVLSYVDVDYLQSITINDMYSFIEYCQNERKSCAGTRSRKIISIRQFWKYLRKVNMIDTNPAESLETPKLPKRVPRYLSLEESVRLLIVSKDSPRDHCILTLLLNCALRVSEIAALNVSQISSDILHVIGKGNKERKIFLTPAAKTSINDWLILHNQKYPDNEALFVSKHNTRMTSKAFGNIVKKYVALAGIDSDLISTHKLRHTAATLMYKYGKVDLRSLQLILGHESVATTEIYTHIDERQLQAAVNSNPLAIMFN